jgi:multisubunit Na+/H+ antiporter MnhB subunit
MSRRNKKEIVGISLVLLFGLVIIWANFVIEPKETNFGVNFNMALWQYRGLDVLGQVMILIAGAFGVVTLLREDQLHD